VFLLSAIRCERNRAPFESGIRTGPDPRGIRAITAEENAVIRALFELPERFHPDTLLLVDSTQAWVTSPEPDDVRRRLPGLSEETLSDYRSRNARSIGLRDSGLDAGRPVVFLTREESWSWEKRFPGGGGAVTLSLPGFNAAGDQALVYWSVFWAPLAAHGSLTLFVRRNGRWTESSTVMLWIS
jgi:hypothetical protein